MNSKPTLIELDPSEITQGAMIGVMRQVQNIKKLRKPAYGVGRENDWQCHIEGALGELALAKFFNCYRAGVGKFRGGDVGRVEVKTRSSPNYDLIVHPQMDDDLIVWLVTGRNGTYSIRGWIMAGEGKQEKWWRDPSGKKRPAYFVPQSSLHSPDEVSNEHK